MPHKDPEVRRAYCRTWYAKNQPRERQRQREWVADNFDKVKGWSRRKLLSRYGITPEKYDELLRAQGDGCAICGATEAAASGRHSFAVDHDHRSGEVRGLLCIACNRGIGLLRDDPDLLVRAAAYVQS